MEHVAQDFISVPFISQPAGWIEHYGQYITYHRVITYRMDNMLSVVKQDKHSLSQLNL